jgi:hypothetical protein
MKEETVFFVVKYVADGQKVPYFFDAKWSPELPKFHYPSGNPSDKDLLNRYLVSTDLSDLVADYLPDHYLASDKFKKLCEDADSDVIVRPVDVGLKGGEKITGKYFFLLPAERISFMDVGNSEFTLSLDKYTKKPLISEEQDGKFSVYETIETLSIDNTVCSHLFFAREIKEIVCSDFFVEMFKARGLIGLEFERLDKNYRYAPWEDF